MFVAVRDLRRCRVILYARQNYEKTFAIKIFARQVLLFMPKINKQQRHSAECPPQTVKKKTVCIVRVRVTQFFSLKTFQPFIFIVIRLDVRLLRMNGLDFKPVIQPCTTLHSGRKVRYARLLPAQATNAITWDNIRAHVRHFSLSPSKLFLSA